MTGYVPGDFVLVANTAPDKPPWPCVVCINNELPEDMRRKRPHGFNLPVLLLHHHNFHWAPISDMASLEELVCSEEDAQRWPDLSAAYGEIHLMLESGWGRDHWIAVRQVDEELNGVQPCKRKPEVELPPKYDPDSDGDLEMAIQASLGNVEPERTFAAAVPLRRNQSPSKRRKITTPDPSMLIPLTDSTASPRLPLPNWEFNALKTRSLFSLTDDRAGRPAVNADMITKTHCMQKPAKPVQNHELQGTGTFASSSPLEGDRTNERKGEDDDENMLNDDLPEDNKIVVFVVGSDHEEKFHLFHKDVKNRDYFCGDYAHSQHYITPLGKKGWRFERPSLKKIEPDDFRLAVQYLESGRFGHIIFETEHDRKIGFDECARAWRVAEELSMDDLSEHILGKLLQLQPWGLVEVLAFATYLYRMRNPSLPTIEKLKDLFVEFIADRQWDYVKEHSTILEQRFKRFPLLQFDVQKKSNQKLEPMLIERGLLPEESKDDCISKNQSNDNMDSNDNGGEHGDNGGSDTSWTEVEMKNWDF